MLFFWHTFVKKHAAHLFHARRCELKPALRASTPLFVAASVNFHVFRLKRSTTRLTAPNENKGEAASQKMAHSTMRISIISPAEQAESERLAACELNAAV